MSAGLRGIVVGTLALSAAQLLLANEDRGGRVSEVFAAPGKWLRDFMSPAKPLIPDLRGGGNGDGSTKSAAYKATMAAYTQAVSQVGSAPPPSTLPPTTPVPQGQAPRVA